MSKNLNKDLSKDVEDYTYALLEKCEEAYLMALEIINKPTIKYRTEGFCFFICNAWELALKAFIIRRENSIDAINFKHNPSQTLGLAECIESVFTSTTDHTKTNLNMVRNIRNKATHNILPDYDFKFATLFQFCVYSLVKFMERHFPEYRLNNQITAFVALSNMHNEVNSPLLLNPASLLHLSGLEKELYDNNAGEVITQTIKLSVTKKSKEADVSFKFTDDAEEKARLIEVPKDANITHPYMAKDVVNMVRESLRLNNNTTLEFNMHTFNEFVRSKRIKENGSYCYTTQLGNSLRYKYSQKLVDYIVYNFSQK